VNGILYFTIPDHVFAISARTGEGIDALRDAIAQRLDGVPARR